MFSRLVTIMNLFQRRSLIIALAISTLFAAIPSQAKEIVIYTQTASTSGPTFELVADSNGTLYGLAEGGGTGAGELGSFYSLTPPAKGQTAWTETVLYSFQGGTDGIYPIAGLTPDGQGGFFGSTTQGGTGTCPILFGQGGCGTIVHLSPPEQGQTAWTETVLYSFQGGADGNEPAARLLMDPNTGVLYGITYLGGEYGAGTVFAIAPPGRGQTNWTEPYCIPSPEVPTVAIPLLISSKMLTGFSTEPPPAAGFMDMELRSR